MLENVKTIEEFFKVFEKVAGDFKWTLYPGFAHPEWRMLREDTSPNRYCPIESLFGYCGAFALTKDWDKFVRATVIDSSDGRPRRTSRFDPEVRSRLLKICGVSEDV